MKSIYFIDIDETVFHTFALIHVMKGNKVVKKLTNQEFNTYVLQKGERFTFDEFRDAQIFLETSKPIMQVINQIKELIKNSNNKIIFLTARADFDNKETFLQAFRNVGIDIDNPNVYVERTGNMTVGTVDEKKKTVMMKYLSTGEYSKAYMYDDCQKNLDKFLTLNDELAKITCKAYLATNDTLEIYQTA